MYGSSTGRERALTVPDLRKMKADGDKIAVVTAYDASQAHVLEQSGVDVVLVGDSLGMVIQGHRTTLSVTVDHVVYHTGCVVRGASRTLVIADMPFLAFSDVQTALRNAGRLMAEGGAQMVKLEGAGPVIDATARLVDCGIPVCAHLGLTPQSVHQLGGFKVQGKDQRAAEQMIDDARSLESAGAAMVVLECIPVELAAQITDEISIPTIGIGAGVHCDGQVLVWQDMLGMGSGRKPRFVRNFAPAGVSIREGVAAFVGAVKDGSYPTVDESYG